MPSDSATAVIGFMSFDYHAHNGLASARREGRVPRPLGPCLRGLCALKPPGLPFTGSSATLRPDHPATTEGRAQSVPSSRCAAIRPEQFNFLQGRFWPNSGLSTIRSGAGDRPIERSAFFRKVAFAANFRAPGQTPNRCPYLAPRPMQRLAADGLFFKAP